MIHKNPPSFVLIEKATGLVVYTKRATGVGSEAINACVAKGRVLAAKTGKVYTVFLDIMGLKVGMKVNVAGIYALGITEEIHPVSKNPGRVRKNIFTFNNPPSGPADRDAARELELYIDNDSQLYHQQFIPIVKNLMLKRRKGIYRNDLAKKLFMYLMDAGARKYVAEFGTPGQKIDSMFNRNTRMLAANHFVFAFENEAELGNYDRLIGPVSNPRPLRKGEKKIRCGCGRTISLDGEPDNDLGDYQCVKCGQWWNSFGQALKDPSEWDPRYDLDNPRRRGVRKNIFAFNNPRKLNTLEQAAASVGLYVTTWAPGDGKTRYRFHRKPADYHDGTGIYTAVGRADALNFIKAYGIGKERKNPPSKSVRSYPVQRGLEEQVASMLRNAFIWAKAGDGEVLTVATPTIAKTAIIYVKKYGWKKNPLTPAERRAINRFEAEARSHNQFATSVGDRGGAIFTSGQYNAINRIKNMVPCKANPCPNPKHRHARRNPSPIDPPGLAELDARMNDLMRKMDAMKKAKTDGSPQYMILLKEAQAVSRERVKLIGLGGKVLPNPLLQTVLLANPPISVQWDRMTRRQREALLEIVGYDRDYSGGMTMSSWKNLSPSAKHKLEAQWLDTTSSGGTTKRRRAAAVGANPLTRKESGKILRSARRSIATGSVFRPGHTRSALAGKAIGKAHVVTDFGPRSARGAARKIHNRAEQMVGTAMSNPGIKFPKPGTKMTVAQAMDLARRIGDRELIKQCEAAAKLQSKANRGSKCVIWKTLPIGSPNRIDMVTAFSHYGDSPEDMYRPPKGSKKGTHMYRHKWGEGTGRQKPVPVLAAPSGKAIIKVMGPGQKVGDWMRG